MEDNKQKTLKVELIGGPLCGLITDWPEHTPSLVFSKHFARYEFEGLIEEAGGNNNKFTALYKGYAEE